MNERPLPVVREYYYGQPKYTLNYDVVEHDGLFDYSTVELPNYVWGYNEFVSAMLKERYGEDGIESITNNYLANYPNLEISGEYIQLQRYRGQCKIWARELMRYSIDNNLVLPYLADEFDALENTRAMVLQKISNYDISDNVNCFFLGEIPVWLTKMQRESLLMSLNMFVKAGVDTFPFVIGGVAMELPVGTIEMMLAAVEVYATRCMMVTDSHKANVAALTTEEEMLAYDYTAGYPERPSFNVNP